MPHNIEGLRQVVSGVRRLLIVVHDNPDPDALASGCALARLLKQTDNIRARLCCEGIVGRAENITLVRGLRLKLMDASRVKWDNWPHVALVDAQPGTGNNSFPRKRIPLMVLDHHPLRSKTRARFIDVRAGYGATTTILSEYLRAANVTPASDLAAAMCYGISTDTQDMAREACAADTAEYLWLYPFADKRLLGRILHPRLPHEYYATLARAVMSAFSYANVIGSHLAEVTQPDMVGLVADLLLQHERMGWCIVTGIWDDSLYISLRAREGRHHAGDMLRRVLTGKKGAAGGHETMAGGRIPVKGLDAPSRERLQNDLVLRLIQVLKRRKDVALKPLLEPAELLNSLKRLA